MCVCVCVCVCVLPVGAGRAVRDGVGLFVGPHRHARQARQALCHGGRRQDQQLGLFLPVPGALDRVLASVV